MRTLSVFEQISLDGAFADHAGDMSFAHKGDPEWVAFTEENARAGGELLFGRKTYEQMASFWPTPAARALMPAVAERMNEMKKTVFSRTLGEARWQNTTLVKDDLAGAVAHLKASEGPGLTVMGSGSIVSQLVAAGLVDVLTLVVNPIVLGSGRPLFAGIERHVPFALVASRAFGNGNVVLTYEKA